MSDVHKTVEAVWKAKSTRLIVAIARVTRDIGVAEELAQDALLSALAVWPKQGVPDNPGAWLMTAAKRRALDSLRRGQMLQPKARRHRTRTGMVTAAAWRRAGAGYGRGDRG